MSTDYYAPNLNETLIFTLRPFQILKNFLMAFFIAAIGFALTNSPFYGIGAFYQKAFLLTLACYLDYYGISLFVRSLFPDNGKLILSSGGLSYQYFYKKLFYPWTEIKDLSLYSFSSRGGTHYWIRFKRQTNEFTIFRWIYKLIKIHGYMVDKGEDFTPQELALIIIAWWEYYGKPEQKDA